VELLVPTWVLPVLGVLLATIAAVAWPVALFAPDAQQRRNARLLCQYVLTLLLIGATGVGAADVITGLLQRSAH
jgi:hypothetical protein